MTCNQGIYFQRLGMWKEMFFEIWWNELVVPGGKNDLTEFTIHYGTSDEMMTNLKIAKC